MAVRIGLVGAGGIGRVHLDAITHVPDAVVVAVCDTDRARAEALATKVGAAVHINFRTMIEREKMDALYVCLPPSAHSDVEVLAAQKGMHVFVEKPVALSAERADQIAEEIEKAGIITSAGYTWRYFTGVEKAREFLKGRPIGMVIGQWLEPMPSTLWWRQKEESGGQIVEQATHLFDLGRLLCGEADTVFAVGSRGIMARKSEGHTVDDANAVAVRFRNGIAGCFYCANMLPASAGASFRVLAEDVVVEITARGVEIIEKGRRVFTEHAGDPFVAEAEAFVAAVAKSDKSLVRSDYADAVRTLKATLAAQKSVDTGKPITL